MSRTASHPDAARPWRIDISGGANHGASVALAPGSYTIGGALDNDIVLAGPAVAGQQVRIDVGPHGAVATPLAAGLLHARRPLAPGTPLDLQPGARLHLGDMLIRMSGPQRTQRRPVWALFAGAVVLIAASFAAAFQFAAPALVTASAAAAPAADAAAARSDPAAVRDAFRQRLQMAGLDGKVALAATGHAVTATGALMPSERDAWLAAQQWFDGRFGHDTVLVDRVGIAAPQQLPRLDVAAVALRPIPHVVTRDGQQYIVGAVLAGGWSISAITGRAITLRLGACTIEIAL